MFIHYISSSVSLLMLLRLFTILVFPSTLVYSLTLVGYVSFLVTCIVINSSIGGLIGLLVLLVYVGAIMIIISYICAVSPNIKYCTSIGVMVLLFFIFVALLLSSVLPAPSSTPCVDTLTPSFLFTDLGLPVVIVLCLSIVLILIYSTYTSPIASSLRSTHPA